MNTIGKQKALHWSEALDSLRVFPRLFLLACFVWVVHLSYYILDWYFKLPPAQRGAEATGVVAATFIGALGFLKLVYSTYAEGGRQWGQPAAVTTSVSASSTTTSVPP